MELQKQNYSLKETPWYFGAYLNMARHNVYLISNEISAKLNLNRILNSDEAIPNSFLTKEEDLNSKNPRLIFSNLIRYLPIARVFSSDLLNKDLKEAADFQGIDFAQMVLFLKKAFIELNTFRNDYSHYYSSATLDKRKDFVDDDFAVMLRKQFYFAISSTKSRMKDVIPESSFDFVEKEISKDLFDENNKITTRGLVFFCCLFLDKENAFHFFNKVTGFKDTRTFDFLATREVFTVFCVKLPHDKFVSENPKQAFQLDMLNYLNRAPKELYFSLSDEGQKIFQPNLSEIGESNIIENSINETVEEFDYEEYIQAISSKKRNNDRFAEFSLKYLEQTASFSFGFHINLGKSRVKSYKKTVLGIKPEENNRNIEKSIKTFGKLATFQKETDEEREGVQNQMIKEYDFKKMFTGRDIKYFTQFSPRYHIKNNKIGILSSQNRKYFNKLYRPLVPDAFLSIHELAKVALLELLNKGKSSELITDFLTRNSEHILNRDFIEDIKTQLNFKELQRQFFDDNIQLKPVNKQASYYVEYESELRQRKDRLNEILSDHSLDANQIPGRIVDYWLNIKEVKKEATIKNRIKAERKDCKQRLKDLENGKFPKVGEMATFLARDIVNLVIDKDVKKKITSFYYDIMQECLALYADSKKRQLFQEICGKELKLFDKNNGHPFLKDIDFDKINETKELYSDYLKNKGEKAGNWLQNTFYFTQKNKKTGRNETIIKISDDTTRIPYSYYRLTEDKSDFKTWLNSVTKGNKQNPNPKPIDLPTNLFDSTLIEILTRKAGIKGDTKYNYSKLLALWLNETQPFYNEKRKYVLFKEKPYEAIVEFDPKENKPFKDSYSSQLSQTFNKRKTENKRIQKQQINRVFKKAIDENEKIIRFYQTKDRVSLMILNELIGKDLEISLNEISPVSEKGPLNEVIEIRETIHGKIIKDHRKRKNFSIFRKLISDKRLPGLFQYFDTEEVTYEVLKKELDDYDREKEQVFKVAFDMEKVIIENASDSEYDEIVSKGTSLDNANISHNPYLDWLLKYNIINETERGYFSNVRKKIAHNQFPELSIVKTVITSFNNDTFSSQIISDYIDKINEIISNKLVSK